MNISVDGLNMIKDFEGCVLHSYKVTPEEEYYTIGYGHYGPDVSENEWISLDEAEKYLKSDMMEFETEVNAWNFHYKWNQHEFDAMVSFAYNNGIGGFRNLIKNGTRTKEEISVKMLLYVTDGYNELPGLVTRRERERALFLLPCDEEPEEDYVYVMDVVKAIWDGKFGNDEERKERLYEYFQDKVNKFVR